MENNNQIIKDSIKNFVDFLYEEFADDEDNNRLNRFLDQFEILLQDVEGEYVNRFDLLDYINDHQQYFADYNGYSQMWVYFDISTYLISSIGFRELLQECINEKLEG